MSLIETIPLHETARSRYLNYALSVITSRALPDIRDGLKPVQRRILYAMFASLRLYPDARYRKSATIVGECFIRDTLVATENGLIPIQEIRRGNRVYTETGLKPVTELYEMPEKNLLRITLDNGLSNTVTSEQPIRVLNDELELVWKDAEDLRTGDWVVLKKAACFSEVPVELGSFGGKQIFLDEEVGYILGALVSDGWVSADYGTKGMMRLGFCSSDLGVIDKIRRCFTSVFDYTPTLEVAKESVYVVRINNAALNQFFSDHFELTASLTAHTKFIPQKVLRSPASVVRSFIAGLFDGDGCLDARHARARYVSVSKRLIDQLQILLQHLGILAGRHTLRQENPDWAPLHSLEIHGQYAKKLIHQVKFERATLKTRAELIRPMKTYPSSLERVPFGSKVVFTELSNHHLGGGWYEDSTGNKFRQGIAYPEGTKIRYCTELHEKPLAFSQLEDWGILDKLDRIGSSLYDTLQHFIEHDLFFVKVKVVEAVAPEKTYDLQVEEDHNFIANGMVAHNCMGKYHPHGDTAIYDAMVRMAQDFSLRDPLVDGHGNFGSLDGDRPAAMRYTEAKLRALAMEMLVELRQQTVEFRPNFDGTLSEPVVLPSRFPNLLINGATGIAVGMATNIPPHNLGEVVDASIYMVDARRKQVKEGRNGDGWPAVRIQTLVSKFVKGPDFPTGGRILNTEEELFEIYKKGEGAINLRGEYKKEGKSRIIVTSIPYAVTKGDLVEKIAEHIAKDRVPQLTDIRDESTDTVRIVLELKRGAKADAAMAYLFKHTPLQTRFHVNLTCLVPTDNPQVAAPEKVDLATVLHHFLDFRLDVVTRRLQHELAQLEKRIHILEGFEKIFDAIDEAIKIIRSSKDKADSSQRLRHRFRLDEIQADAILETKLYKLSQLEIEAIREELAAKKKRAAEIRKLLKDEAARWMIVRDELKAIKQQYATDRRSDIAGPDATKYEYSEEDFIVDEDAYVIVTRDGWVKRQRSYTEMDNIRIREGDEIGWILPGRTRNTVAFLSNFGRAYTVRVDELPSTTGYGSPVQKLFGFTDKERVVGVISFDKRVLPKAVPDPELEPDLFKRNGEVKQDKAVPYLVAFSRSGMAVRLTIDAYTDPSTKNGRLFMRPAKGDEVVGAEVAGGDENACLASRKGHVLIFPVKQIPIFKSAAKGVIAMRLGHDDRVLGATVATGKRDGLVVETSRGRRETVRTTKFEITNRGNKGRQIIKRGHLAKVVISPIEIRLNGTR